MFTQRDQWLLKLKQTLAHHRIPLNPPNALVLLEQMLCSLEHEFGEPLDSGSTAGVLLHLLFSCVPERRRIYPGKERSSRVRRAPVPGRTLGLSTGDQQRKSAVWFPAS